VLGAIEGKVVVACVEVPRVVFISTTDEGANEISCEACAFVIMVGGAVLPRRAARCGAPAVAMLLVNEECKRSAGRSQARVPSLGVNRKFRICPNYLPEEPSFRVGSSHFCDCSG
jgi:hypothetical protein